MNNAPPANNAQPAINVTAGNNQPAALNSVTVKLPPFWATSAKVWFRQTEAQFHLRHIVVDSTKYYHVVSALDQDTASRVADLLDNPPENNMYQTLKDRLLDTYELTESQRASQLLHMSGLGDRKPSQLMDDMLALAGTHTTCFLFKQIFLEQMPADIRIMLADEDFGDLRRLAKKADTLWHSRQHEIGINKVGRGQPNKKTVSERSNPAWCFFHNKWGAKAQKCQDPCSFSENAKAGRQ